MNIKKLVISFFKENKLGIATCILSLSYTTFGVAIHTGYNTAYADYFMYPALIAPFILLILSKDFFKDLLVAFILIFFLAFCSEVFWNYMDKPWFTPPETNTCDGPCYGWFSFENDQPLGFIYLVGIFSIALGSLTKGVITIISPLFTGNRKSQKSKEMQTQVK